MTDIEAKALALINDVREERHYPLWMRISREHPSAFEIEALCRAIERHEAYKEKVSDKVEKVIESCAVTSWGAAMLDPLIIPKPQPDPLVEAIAECDDSTWEEFAADLRAALDARGLEIREKGQ
jgi:hypothetical protein